MFYYLLNRIITGDTLFGLAIYAACTLAFGLALCARWPRWLQFAYGAVLAFGLMIIAHYYIDQLQVFWVTPINEPMRIVK